ncbi:unnamed protein product [Sphagnum tenellum]
MELRHGAALQPAWSSTARCSAAAAHATQRGIALQRYNSSRFATCSRAAAPQRRTALQLRSSSGAWSEAAAAPQLGAALKQAPKLRACCSTAASSRVAACFGVWSGAAVAPHCEAALQPLRTVKRHCSATTALEHGAALQHCTVLEKENGHCNTFLRALAGSRNPEILI